MSSISHIVIEFEQHPDGCTFLDIEWTDDIGPGSYHEKLHSSATPRQVMHYAAMIVGRLEDTSDTVEILYEQLAFPDAGPFPPSSF